MDATLTRAAQRIQNFRPSRACSAALSPSIGCSPTGLRRGGALGGKRRQQGSPKGPTGGAGQDDSGLTVFEAAAGCLRVVELPALNEAADADSKPDWRLASVRWIRRGDDGTLEFGTQLFSGPVEAVSLERRRQGGGSAERGRLAAGCRLLSRRDPDYRRLLCRGREQLHAGARATKTSHRAGACGGNHPLLCPVPIRPPVLSERHMVSLLPATFRRQRKGLLLAAAVGTFDEGRRQADPWAEPDPKP